MTKKSRQKLSILITKRAFQMKEKAFFFSISKSFQLLKILRPESAPLTSWRLSLGVQLPFQEFANTLASVGILRLNILSNTVKNAVTFENMN